MAFPICGTLIPLFAGHGDHRDDSASRGVELLYFGATVDDDVVGKRIKGEAVGCDTGQQLG